MGAGWLTGRALGLDSFREEHRVTDADADLVDGCRRGDLAAFERLYVAHARRMKSLAYNLTGSVQDAEDAVQDTFLKVYRRLAGFRGQSAFSSWVYRILVNTCHDIRRRRRRRPELPEVAPDEADGHRPPAPAADHPLRLTLERSLARLGRRQRSVFVLFEVEGFRHREIAEILEIREGTSKFLLFDAKRRLQELISGTRHPGPKEA